MAFLCRLILGNPMPDKMVVVWNVFSWTFATVLAGAFLVGKQLGPYKGLYCCVKETEYRAYAVAPIIVVTFTALLAMSYFYYQSYLHIKSSEGKRAGASGMHIFRVWYPTLSPWRQHYLATALPYQDLC